MVHNERVAYIEIKEHFEDQVWVDMVVDKALEWAFDASRGRLWVSSAGGTWNVLAGNLARFLGIDYNLSHTVLHNAALNKYGPDYYGILWYRCGIKDLSDPYRDARGVKTYLERLQKRGKI